MNALLDKPETVIPTKEDSALATASSRVLSKSKEKELRVQVDGETIALPKAVTRLLSHLLVEMSQGNAVTVIPIHAEMTTQEAADYLNVSRPYFVSLLQANKIAYRMVGTHRRVKFEDLHSFKLAQEVKSNEALDQLAAQAQELGMGY